jgi:hypothetical protein
MKQHITTNQGFWGIVLGVGIGGWILPVHGEPNRPAQAVAGVSGDAAIAESLVREVYTPLPGQIPFGVDDVGRVLGKLASLLTSVPAGPQGRESDWFSKVQGVHDGIQVVNSTRLQTDLINQIVGIADLFEASIPPAPEFVESVRNELHVFSVPMVHSIKGVIENQNGTLTSGTLRHCLTFFSVDGFVSEADWEDEPMPVDAAGIMILDAAAVASELKAQSWQRAELFIGGRTVEEAFARYSGDGTGLPVLKSKYAANKALVEAKWNEVQAWVEAQRPASDPDSE